MKTVRAGRALAPVVLIAAFLALAPSVSSAATVNAGKAYEVTATLASAQVPVLTDTPLTISGVVVPNVPKAKVVLQIHRSGQWVNYEVLPLNGASRFSTVIRENAIGQYAFRVVKGTSGAIHTGVSNLLNVTVQVWKYLINTQSISSSGGVNFGAGEMNGTNYPHSILFGFNSYLTPETDEIDYDVARHCTLVKGVIGIDDYDPDPSDTAEFNLETDGTSVFDQTFSYGQSKNIELGVAGVLRFSILVTMNSNADNDINLADMGNPSVLCY
jgi:hypothetical protein